MNQISLESRLAIALWRRGNLRVGQFIENALGQLYPCAGMENSACVFHIPDETFVRHLEDYADSLTDGRESTNG